MDDLFEENEIVEERAVNPSRTVAVLTTAPVERAYDYAVPEGMELVPGDYVRVPMGKSLVPGVVWGPGAGDVPPARLKNVHARVDLPAMSCAHRAFVDRVAAYTLSPAGAVLKMALSVPGALEPPESVRAYGCLLYTSDAADE